MPIAQIHLTHHPSSTSPENPLPPLLRLPSGLALLELQGTLNFPDATSDKDDTPHPIGTIVFPNATKEGNDLKQLKTVWLYVGKHQRLTGEVKALPKPLGVLRKKNKVGGGGGGDVVMGGTEGGVGGGSGEDEELEIVDVIKYRIIFSSRPEPVT